MNPIGFTPTLGGFAEQRRCGLGVTSGNRHFVCLLECPQCWAIGDVDERKLKGAETIIAASGVEFRTVVGECKWVPLKNRFESGSSGLHLSVGVFALHGHDVGESPVHFRITA